MTASTPGLVTLFSQVVATPLDLARRVRPPRVGVLGATAAVVLALLLIPSEPARMQTAAPGGVTSGLALWLKANDGPTSLDASGNFTVAAGSSWLDRSGSGRNADLLPGAGNDPQLIIGPNFNPTVRFDGGDWFRFSTSPFVSAFTAGEVFTIAKSARESGQSNNYPYDFGGNSNSHYVANTEGYYDEFGTSDRLGWHAKTFTILDAKAGVSSVGGLPLESRAYHILATHSATNDWGVHFDGFTAASTTTNTTNFALIDGERIGAGSAGTFLGEAPEYILYNRTLTTLERQKVNSYLAIKYGITQYSPAAGPQDYVTSVGTVIWQGIANSAYHKNVAGIGRDDGSALDQRQARSIQTTPVVIGFGNEIAADNASHSGGLADQQFLVWGDNGASHLFETAITPPAGVTADLRMPRAWRVDETGAVGSVKVAVPAGRANPGPVYVIVSNDETFDSGDQWIELTPYMGGSTPYMAADVDFNDNQYFTFATAANPVAPGNVAANLKLWLKADAGITGSPVTSWADSSSRGNDANIRAGTAQALVASAINFNPAIQFKGTGGLEGTFDLPLTSSTASAFIVMKPRSGFDGTGTINSSRVFAVNLAGRLESDNTASALFFFRNSKNINAHRSFGVSLVLNVYDRVGVFASHFQPSGQHVMVYGGTSQTPVSFAATPFHSDRFSVGLRPNNLDLFFGGEIAEVLLYEADQRTPGTEARIASYLALKYGVTLSHNYVASDGTTTFWDVTANTGYNNNIAGIGRDDASAVLQRQSRSQSSNLVTIGLGNTIAATNAANSASFAADRQFMMWGDNGASDRFQTPVTPPVGITANRRMPRVWRVDETGTIGSVKVAAPVGVANLTPAYLIVSNDATFDAADQWLPLAPYAEVGGTTQYVAADFDFSDGQYFTFAGAELAAPGGAGTNLKLWLKADADVTGAPVVAWGDQSGRGNDATIPIGTPAQTLVGNALNFNPVVRFNATSGLQGVLDAPLTSNNASAFIVMKPTTRSGSFSPRAFSVNLDGLLDHNNLDGGIFFYMNSTTARVHRNGVITTTIPNVTGKPGLFAAHYKIGNQEVAVYNGTAQTPPGTQATTAFNANRFNVGTNVLPNTAEKMLGDIAEIVLYDTDQAAAGTEPRIASYLALKYGITLSHSYVASNGGMVWDVTANTGYNNNIAGIGRDDTSALDQRQSRTVNTTTGTPSVAPDIVTMGHGAIATDNPSNPNPFTADRSFLVWGDNAASTHLTTNPIAGAPVAELRRMSRVWRVQESGTVNAVLVRAGLNTVVGSNRHLVRSMDPTFASGNTFVALTTTASGYEGTTNFASGEYFTFAAVPPAAPGGVFAGLNLWLRADAGTNVDASNKFLVGGGGWRDQSGYGRHADVVKGVPLLVAPAVNTATFVNFNPAVSFTSSHFLFTNRNFADKLIAGEVFSVVKDLSPTSGNHGHPFDLGGLGTTGYTNADNSIWEDFGSNDRVSWFPATQTLNTVADGAKAGVSAVTGLPINTGQYHIYSAHSAANDWGVRFDGFTALATTTNTVSFGLNGGQELIGARPSRVWHGVMPEVFLYERTLTETERQQINSYLGIKYGITQLSQAAGPQDYLTSAGTTIWHGIANGAYHGNVAGIGRDDKSALNQKQSKNIEPGSFVSMSVGPFAATNQANTGTLTDQSFLVWGRDTGALSVSVDVTGGLYKRMVRVWRAQETGAVGPVVVRIPYGYLSGRNQSLIRSADAVFTDADPRVPLVRNGQFYEATVDFAGVELFTFGVIPYEPGGVGGEALWVKANDGLLTDVDNGNPTQVTEWLDQSGSGNTTTELRAAGPVHTDPITPSTDIIQMPVGVNFNPAVKFTGASGKSLKGNAAGDWDAGPLSIFAIALRDGAPAASPAGLFTANGSWEGAGAGAGLIANSGNYGLDGNGCSTALTTLAITQPRLVRGLYTTAGNGNGGGTWIDGTTQGAGTACATSATTFFEVGGRTSGATTNNNRVFNGKIAEVVVYKGALSAAQTDQVESYLALKYGITLDQTSPRHYVDALGATVWDATLNATYKNNIAGIGRDDLSGLDQRQSKSSAAGGGLVTVGHGAITADNLSNTNAFTADRSFLIWGHDGASSSWGTPVPSTLLQRLLRVWRAQETGTLGSVVVRIPRAVLGVQNPRLLRSVDPTFDGSDTQVPMTVNGIYLEAAIDFATGDYFTFASESAPAPLNAGDGLVTEGHIKGMVLNTPVCPAYPWQHAPRTTSGLSGGMTGQPVGTATATESTWVGDVTGDAVADLVHARENEGIAVWTGNGDGTFATTAITTSITSSFTVGHSATETTFLGDVNGDAAIDLISVTDGSGVSANSGTRVWLGNGDGTFDPAPIADLGAFTGTVAGVANIIQAGYNANETTLLADVTGDGRMDLVWVHDGNGTAANSGVWTWAGNGDGTFNHTPIVDTGFTGTLPGSGAGTNVIQAGANANESTHAGDFNGDGNIDILWVYDGAATPANSGTWFWAGNGNGTFSHTPTVEQGVFTSGPSGASVIQAGNDGNQVTRTADVNNDGRLDVVWANGPAPNGVWVWMGAGNGTFTHTPTADSGAFVSFDAGVSATEDNFIIDLNGDGALDFVSLSDTGATARAFLAVDTDGDGIGDLVDTDDDGDGIADASDSCPVPGSIGTGLQLWLKADAGTTVDGTNNFVHWADQSPFARDANVVTSDPEKVGAALSFNPTVRFDGGDYFQFGKSPFVTAFTAGEVFTVTKSTTPAGVSTTNPYDFGSGSRAEHYVHSDNAIYNGFGTTDRLAWDPIARTIVPAEPKAGVSSIAGPAVDPRNYHLFGSYSAANDWATSFDGIATAATTTNTVSFALLSNEAIAASTNLATPVGYNGEIAEVILYNRKLTTQERQEVASYLGTKYGITIGHDYLASDDTTIYWDMAANAAYHNSVAGLGRDDGATLNQRQSISVNPGSFVAIGLGTLAADNPSHPNTFTTDRTFMMWGDNNASAGFDAVIAGPTVGMANRRMSRIWKIQETAAVGSVMLGVPETIGVGNTVYLVVSSDATFDAADTWLPLGGFTAGATDYLATTLDFANGQFFTFATMIQAPGGVTGMALWVKANDGPSTTTDGTNVGTWADRSGASKDLSVLDDTKDVQPTYTSVALNFNPAVSLLNDATSDQGFLNEGFLGDEEVNYNIDGSVFFAHIPRKTTDCNTLGQLALTSQDHPSMGLCASNGGQLFGTNDFPAANTTWSSGAGLTAPADVPALSGYTWRYNQANSFFFRNNGAAVANAALPSHSGRDFHLMRDTDDNVNDGAGDMSEAVMYTRQLTALENQKVDSYLAIKYGVTLNQSTPTNYLSSTNRIIWNAATAGSYNQNIAGIGRDDASALAQRQSRSVNLASSGDFVTIGVGTIAVDNVSNATNFAADDSFLVWSDDGAAATFTAPILTPSGSTESRLLRTWLAQESNTVGTVKVAVPSGTGAGAPVYLVVSNDPVFDGADTWRALTPFAAGTASYLAADVDFANGQYFTFATVSPEDFGDAPVGYPTLAAGNGARHAMTGYDIVTGAASLMLGTRIDPELDGQPSTAADGDDTTGADDDDGVVFPPLAAGAAASLTVTVTNSGPAARLNAWADWNNNGSFTDVGEQIATDLAVSAGPNAVNVAVPPSAGGAVNFRFRLSTQAGLAPTGAATDGEVEDYQVALGSAETRLTITKTDGQTSYVPGSIVAYTIRVTNAGPANASGVGIADLVPVQIGGLSVSCVTTGSASCGTNASAGNNVSFTGASVAAGAGNQITLTIQGTVSTAATGTLTNTAAVTLGPSQTDSDPTDNTATDIDTQSPSETNLELTKTGPATVMVSQNVSYIITVTNHGPSVATNVVVTDPTPAGLTFLSTGTGCTTAFPCALGTMAPGEIRQISATYRVEPGYPTATPIENTASVTGSELDPVANNSQTATTTAQPSANVEVQKTVDDATPAVGETVTFTVTVLNHGPSDATGIEVRDVLPAELTFVSATPSQGTFDQATGLWTVGAVPLSGSATMTLTATVNAPGSVTNLAVKTAQNEPDSSPGDDSAGATLTGAPSADIWVDKTVDRPLALVGENVTFTVTVTNRGPSPATGIEIDDVLPAGLSLVSATPSQGTYDPATGVWTIGGMSATGQATLTLVTALTQAGPLVNQASVRHADQHDPDTLNDTWSASVNAQANADILVGKTVSNTAPAVGASVTYTISATNLGPSDATSVEILDVLPAGLTFVSASPSQGTYDDTIGTWSVGPLAHTVTAILTITATVNQPGPIANTAARQSGGPVDPNPANDDETATITAGREADLVVTKTPSSPTVTAGNAMSWTIVVTNNGPSPVTGASVTDTFDAAFLSPTWTCATTVGSSCAAMSGSGNIATTVSLLAGGVATFTASGTVDPSATALSNTAIAWPPADTTDPDTSDNSPIATVTVVSSADLQVTKTGPADTRPGTSISYTITVTNAGPSSATGVTLDDPTPAGLVPVSVTGACTAFPCPLGALLPAEVRTVTAMYSVPVGYSGPQPVTNTATIGASTPDPVGTNNSGTAMTTFRRQGCDVNGDGIAEFVTGAGAGGGPHVRIWDVSSGSVSELHGFFAYDPAFSGGVTVACGDVTGDGVAEIVTGAGGGGGPHVRVWHYTAGSGLSEVAGWFAYHPAFPGGVKVAVGDVNGDGVAEIITGAGPGGGPHVRFWSLAGGTLTELFGQGYWGNDPAFSGGVFLGTGDVDGDGTAEVVIGPGENGAPLIRVWSMLGGATERASFMAYHPAFPGGVSVAVGDLDGDGSAEVITAAGPRGGPHVRIWHVGGGAVTEVYGQGFFAYDPAFSGGVFVAAGDLDGDGVAELITAPGPGGGPHVRVWRFVGGVLTEVTGFFAYHPAFPGGVFVGR